MNERLRRRRAFADQELMETTLTEYYLQMPTTSYSALNFNNTIDAVAKHIKVESEAPSRPKISFSIESIIGIK